MIEAQMKTITITIKGTFKGIFNALRNSGFEFKKGGSFKMHGTFHEMKAVVNLDCDTAEKIIMGTEEFGIKVA